ncbi:hypothetical protein AMAG_20053 [Allomyces macrogynus ATCC 38327]|uniref:Uncharacterized protein n=1 Tax=Allomyces macrogynus (strain ATCC 38327) TaxID=578462 RepID=A0A0L0T541_ALLM3|nr:hypothetical protein AMAG_20053 [Allomyces macrogynus ATCC 38327]|eukprot:KNE69826.1 hypothetical protein AMAG_20053 [Allomyces macrogynus ATCC 38327]
MHVPSTAEAMVGEVDAPDEFRADLTVDQKRAFEWLFNFERDRAARTRWIRQPPHTSTEEDLL